MSHKSWGELCRASDLGHDWEGLAGQVAGTVQKSTSSSTRLQYISSLKE
jgi:hypothetical protein